MNNHHSHQPELDPTSRIAGERTFHIGLSADTIADIYSKEVAFRNNLEDNDDPTAASRAYLDELNDRINRGDV